MLFISPNFITAKEVTYNYLDLKEILPLLLGGQVTYIKCILARI